MAKHLYKLLADNLRSIRYVRRVVAAGLFLALVGLSLVAACGGGEEGSPGKLTVPPDDPKALGPADAAVMIVEYADFQ